MFKIFKKLKELDLILKDQDRRIRDLSDRVAVLEFKDRNRDEIMECRRFIQEDDLGRKKYYIEVTWYSKNRKKLLSQNLEVTSCITSWHINGEYLEVFEPGVIASHDSVYKLNFKTDTLDTIPIDLYFESKVFRARRNV